MSPFRQIIAVAAMCVVAIAGYSTLRSSPPARAATPAGPGMPAFLRFSGSGSTLLRPDRASIHFSTDGRGVTLAEATNQASTTMRRVLAALHMRGIASYDMHTDAVSGSRNDTTGEYSASQDLTVTVRTVSQTGTLLAAGIRVGATATYGPEFSLASQHEGQRQAIEAAVGNARVKADAAAAAAHLRVTGVLSVSESNPAFVGYQQTYAASSALTPDAVMPVPIRRGTQRVSATVTVVFGYAPV